MITGGLRIDVDTWRGTRDGVPALCRMLADSGVQASFFFSVGPDNMGRHIWRLVRPTFLLKMLRSNAPGLYGWDILLRGTLWPGPIIGWGQAAAIQAAAEAGHEMGLHAWDHHRWQTKLPQMSGLEIRKELARGVYVMEQILGRPPTASAAPGWVCNDSVLLAREEFPFAYNSDCRGQSIFLPTVDGRTLSQPQIPTTLPTYDEVIGRNGITRENYNNWLLDRVEETPLPVLTIHAEVEGIACAPLFRQFLRLSAKRQISWRPLGELVSATLPGSARIMNRTLPGREGRLACQQDLVPARACPNVL